MYKVHDLSSKLEMIWGSGFYILIFGDPYGCDNGGEMFARSGIPSVDVLTTMMEKKKTSGVLDLSNGDIIFDYNKPKDSSQVNVEVWRRYPLNKHKEALEAYNELVDFQNHKLVVGFFTPLTHFIKIK